MTKLLSYPKINLFLNVTGLKNGYHTIETLFLKIKRPFDTIYIKEGKLKVKAFGINEKENLVYRILKDSGLNYDIKIIKRIPIGSGLGGGSSNAATIIKKLNINIDTKKYGMDINFFLSNSKIAFAEEFGNKIKPINYNRKINLILIIPYIKKSTKQIYKIYDLIKNKYEKREVIKFILRMIKDNRPFNEWFGLLFNDLEDAFFVKYSYMKKLKNTIYELTGINPVMTGAGSSFFIPYSSYSYNKLKKIKNCKIIRTYA